MGMSVRAPRFEQISVEKAGVQTAHGYRIEHERRDKEWTIRDYERVRLIARQVAKSYQEGGRVDGKLIWNLLGALDRTPRD